MKLTTKSEYTLLALIFMARCQKDGFVKVEDICAKYGLSKKYLEQMLLILKQNRYVQARRGAKGGYKLSKPAYAVTLAEIIRLMDGPIASVDSVSKYYYSHTPLSYEKKTLKIFKEIRDYVSGRLEKLKLSDLL